MKASNMRSTSSPTASRRRRTRSTFFTRPSRPSAGPWARNHFCARKPSAWSARAFASAFPGSSEKPRQLA